MSIQHFIEEYNLDISLKDGILQVKDFHLAELIVFREINGIIIKDFFEEKEKNIGSLRIFLDTTENNFDDELTKLELNPNLSILLRTLCVNLETTQLGVHIISHSSGLCPNPHFDQLPLRLVSCLDGPGPILLNSKGDEVNTEACDLIIMKGSLWDCDLGPLVHCSPKGSSPNRTLLRIDFLN